MNLDITTLDFAKGGGFVTVVCQDAVTRAVLMVARADREALERTMATGEMHYHSRSRGLWHKGATSGNVQRVVSLHADCDGDAILAMVEPLGPACHTGEATCFGTGDGGRGWGAGAPPQGQHPPSAFPAPHPSAAAANVSTTDSALSRLSNTISSRQAALPLPDGATPSYTQRLLQDRNLRLKKLGEEATELAVACADEDQERAAEEAGDLIYHTVVALAAIGVSIDAVAHVLDRRAR